MKNAVIGLLLVGLIISLFFNFKQNGNDKNSKDLKTFVPGKDSISLTFELRENPDSLNPVKPHFSLIYATSPKDCGDRCVVGPGACCASVPMEIGKRPLGDISSISVDILSAGHSPSSR